jgi:tetratricopeptide (TPR) repeat protein
MVVRSPQMILIRAASFLVIAGVLLVPWPAGAQGGLGTLVLVMPFEATAEAQAPGGTSSASWLGEAAAVLLTDELNGLGYAALPRSERVAVFDRLQLPMSSELTRATMIRVGELIGASELVVGSIHLGDEVTARVRTIQLGSGRQLAEVTQRAPLTDLFGLFGRLAADVARLTGRTGVPDARHPEPMPLQPFENYVKGLIATAPAAQQRFLESAMTQAPRDGRVLTALWEVYAEQGLYDKALAAASAVPADSMWIRQARFAVALSLIELRRFDGAFKELTTIYATWPSAAVSNALGVVQLRRGAIPARSGTAASYFARAVRESPERVDYLFNLGYARAAAGESTAALSGLREVVRRDATDGDAHLVMGAVLFQANRTVEAQRELELARLLGTSLESVPATIAKVPPDLERLSQSLEETPALVALSARATPSQKDQTETAAFHLDLGRRLSAEGNEREAASELRRAIYLAPYEDEPHLLLGRLYERSGRTGQAIDEFKVAIWCRETAVARLSLGRVLLATGDREGAKREVDRALVLDPNSAEARDLLRKIGG